MTVIAPNYMDRPYTCRCTYEAPLRDFVKARVNGTNRIVLQCPRCNQRRTRNRCTIQQTLEYRRLRDGLLRLLGRKCVECGATEKLEIDHVHGRPDDWDAARMGKLQRMKRYIYEHYTGVKIQILCGPCNKRKGKPQAP